MAALAAQAAERAQSVKERARSERLGLRGLFAKLSKVPPLNEALIARKRAREAQQRTIDRIRHSHVRVQPSLSVLSSDSTCSGAPSCGASVEALAKCHRSS